AVDTSITGKLSKAADGTLQLCSGGKSLASFDVSAKGDGSFKLSVGTGKLKNGNKIQAQFINSAKLPGLPTSDLLVGSCSAHTGKLDQPTLNIDPNTHKPTGRLPADTKITTVRFCFNDIAQVDQNGQPQTLPVSSTGTF